MLEVLIGCIAYAVYKGIKNASLPDELEIDYLSADHLLELEKKYKAAGKFLTVKCRKYEYKCMEYKKNEEVSHVLIFCKNDKNDNNRLMLTIQR